MKVYLLRSDCDRYQNLILSNEQDWDKIPKFVGNPILDWKPVKVEIYQDTDSKKNLPTSDFPLLVRHLPVLSVNAVGLLKNILFNHGQILPLESREGQYFLYNVTKVLDALDEKHSEIERFKSSGRIKDIHSYSFNPKVINNNLAFKIPQNIHSEVFVTDLFADAVYNNRLTGFLFKEVWNDKRGACNEA